MDSSGSDRCPPRGRLWGRFAARLKFLPSEQRDSKRDGLSSSTTNFDRSLIADEGFEAGGGMVDSNVTIGFTSIGMVRGIACKGASGVVEAVGVSCKRESDNGWGAVISNVDAAQSQWFEREPYRL